ncbi:hypothetical protein TNCV_2055451 [Trichonephila clavipes]|uniref:Uncharacterized protein n=1 Tax=Trichonephila clavipes TaxID=2585209 RepID=A0A8X6RK59_TRICX|nr:hypothetical protein TNCV_2055451 [Trichonephila clavipes]
MTTLTHYSSKAWVLNTRPVSADEKSLERLEMSTSDRMTAPTPRSARKEERSWLNWEE